MVAKCPTLLCEIPLLPVPALTFPPAVFLALALLLATFVPQPSRQLHCLCWRQPRRCCGRHLERSSRLQCLRRLNHRGRLQRRPPPPLSRRQPARRCVHVEDGPCARGDAFTSAMVQHPRNSHTLCTPRCLPRAHTLPYDYFRSLHVAKCARNLPKVPKWRAGAPPLAQAPPLLRHILSNAQPRVIPVSAFSVNAESWLPPVRRLTA